MSSARPAVTVTAPRTSKPWRSGDVLSATSIGVSAAAARPIGTLTNSTHSQPSESVRIPPKRTPAAPPAPATAPQTPSALLRSAPSAKVVVTIDSAAGEMIAAPRPWTARAVISQPSDCARPPASEARLKSTRPPMNTRRRPKRSAARPPSSRKPPKVSVYALTIHCRLAAEKSSAFWIDGSATLTIEASRTTRNCAELSRTSASQRRCCRVVAEVTGARGPFLGELEAWQAQPLHTSAGSVNHLEVAALHAPEGVEVVVAPARRGGARDVPGRAVVGEDHPVALQRREDDARLAGEAPRV